MTNVQCCGSRCPNLDMSSAKTGIIFFFNNPATTEIYTLSLHDALPISRILVGLVVARHRLAADELRGERGAVRSEEHTSELQSRPHLVCRLLLEKKNQDGKVGDRVVHFRFVEIGDLLEHGVDPTGRYTD